MAITHRTIQSDLLKLALILCSASPAWAAVDSTDLALPAAEASAASTGAALPAIGWQEQPLHTANTDSAQAIPAALAPGQPSTLAHQEPDRNLPDESARNDQQAAIFFSEQVRLYWWQAVPGILVALFVALAMYMRAPIQRKRKYRSIPHDPTGPYARRAP